jgi:pyruvate dehydrogenase E2 component (dihydrolipoamide acetyltransferase)
VIEFKLPSLGSDMDEGKLLEWHVKPGDHVKKGDVLALVDTSKAAVDVEVWEEGTVHELLVQPGETVPVGTVLARLVAPGEAPGKEPPKEERKPEKRKAISPAARKRAAELGVDVEKVTGTGPQGSVTVEDVEKATGPKERDKALEMRKAIAAAMARSKREIPHYYLMESIPLVRAGAWLAEENARRPLPERLLMAALLLKATALGCQEFPEMNGHYRDGAFFPASAVHLGVAISLRQGGLVAPAVHDVQQKSLSEVMKALTDLVKRARAGSLKSSEMSDPTITVTNLGDGGVQAVFGVIYPPQVAIVGFGAPRDGALVATVSGDHRVSDGHRGALFLARISQWLQQPEKL